MKTLFLSVLLLVSTNALADNLDDCLMKAAVKQYEKTSMAKDQLNNNLESCFSYPYGEAYEKCRFEQQTKFEKEIEKINYEFKLRSKACYKYPFL